MRPVLSEIREILDFCVQRTGQHRAERLPARQDSHQAILEHLAPFCVISDPLHHSDQGDSLGLNLEGGGDRLGKNSIYLVGDCGGHLRLRRDWCSRRR